MFGFDAELSSKVEKKRDSKINACLKSVDSKIDLKVYLFYLNYILILKFMQK